MSRSISFIICSNGYGHLKRCLQVVDALPNDYKINFFCKEPQLDYARGEVNFKKKSKINFFSKYSKDEFSWINPDGVSWEKYLAWKNTLLLSVELSESNLIVSDNHVLPVSIFDNVILMGSFLWHDASIVDGKDAKEIVAFEKGLLAKKKVPLICLGDMVMPSLNDQVNLLKKGWFTERADIIPVSSNRNKILITGGGTELINKQLFSLAQLLANNLNDVDLYADSKLYRLAKGMDVNLKSFTFTDEDFASLDFIICRPGIGILTDCVRFTIPAIVINDGFNNEINHNSKMVNNLGIGVSYNINENTLQEVFERISILIKNDDFKWNCKKELRSREVNGAMEASKTIINFIENGKH